MGRLSASERRAAVLDTATLVFSRCSYRGATTAEIARAAGVTEPILYRHFESKQALSEASEDPEIRRYARRHLRDVHDYATSVLGRAQAAGRIPGDRDLDAEGWIFVALGLLGSIGRRLGAVAEEDFTRIREARRRWLTGEV